LSVVGVASLANSWQRTKRASSSSVASLGSLLGSSSETSAAYFRLHLVNCGRGGRLCDITASALNGVRSNENISARTGLLSVGLTTVYEILHFGCYAKCCVGRESGNAQRIQELVW